MEHSAILLTYTKLRPVFKNFVLSIFECPLNAGFTVYLLIRSIKNNNNNSFFKRSRAVNSVVGDGIPQKFKLIQACYLQE